MNLKQPSDKLLADQIRRQWPRIAENPTLQRQADYRRLSDILTTIIGPTKADGARG